MVRGHEADEETMDNTDPATGWPSVQGDLGPLETVLAQGAAGTLAGWGVGALVTLLGTAVLLLGLNPGWLILLRPADKPPDQATLAFMKWLSLIAGTILLACAVRILVQAFWTMGARILVFRNGIVHGSWFRRATIFRWSALMFVRRRERLVDKKLNMIHRSLRLSRLDGKSLLVATAAMEFPHIRLGWQTFEAFLSRVEAEILDRELPRLLEAIAGGDEEAFGEVVISRRGIRWKGGELAWERILAVKIGLHPRYIVGSIRWGIATIHGVAPTFRIDQCPNVALLWVLIDRLLSR